MTKIFLLKFNILIFPSLTVQIELKILYIFFLHCDFLNIVYGYVSS